MTESYIEEWNLIKKKRVFIAIATNTLLKTDYNLDTHTEAVQKAVHTLTLIFLSRIFLFAFLFRTFGAASALISATDSGFPFI